MTTKVKMSEEERATAVSVGFYIDTSHRDYPRLMWLNGNGALSGHNRGATEAELRMWSLLVGREYAPWSLGEPSIVQSNIVHRGARGTELRGMEL